MSYVISADGQQLAAKKATPFWASATEFSQLIWVKVVSAQWGSLFAISDFDNLPYNTLPLRTAAGTTYDHGLRLQNNDMRMDGSGSVTGGWDCVLVTYKQGVAKVSYRNGASQVNSASAPYLWAGGVGFDHVCFGVASYDGSNSRSKLAHGAVWNKALSAAQAAELWNGGAGGAGKNPTAVAPENLVFYAPLTGDATVHTGGVTLTATGTLSFDSGDNPPVESVGGGSSGTVTVAGQSYAYTQGTPSVLLPAGAINIPPVMDWETGLLKLSAGYQADIYNKTTRALIVSKPGLTTHATTGAGSFSDIALSAGTTYRVVTEFADGSIGVCDYTAT